MNLKLAETDDEGGYFSKRKTVRWYSDYNAIVVIIFLCTCIHYSGSGLVPLALIKQIKIKVVQQQRKLDKNMIKRLILSNEDTQSKAKTKVTGRKKRKMKRCSKLVNLTGSKKKALRNGAKVKEAGCQATKDKDGAELGL